MSAILKDETQRFAKVFISYTRVIVGGMLFAALFFFIFAGVKANYISLEILAAVLATLTIGISVILAYFSFRAFRKNKFDSVELALRLMELEEVRKAYKIEISENQIGSIKRQIEQELMSLSQQEVSKRTESLFFVYSTSRLIGFVIAGALRAFVYPETSGFMPKPQEDEAQKHIVR